MARRAEMKKRRDHLQRAPKQSAGEMRGSISPALCRSGATERYTRQARASMKELAGTEGAARAAVAHRLKGSAQSVGATAAQPVLPRPAVALGRD